MMYEEKMTAIEINQIYLEENIEKLIEENEQLKKKLTEQKIELINLTEKVITMQDAIIQILNNEVKIWAELKMK